MGYCIYYKKSEPNVKFTKREHVIPAGLGGIAKLPLGYVSDEANEKFSPIEMNVMRNSIIGVNRNNVGPGKRGSLNVNKIKNPTIRVMKQVDGPVEHYKLGFIFAGETYLITQMAIDFNDVRGFYTTSYYATVFDAENSKEMILEFKKLLLQFLLNRNRKYKLIDMPFETNIHFINIGYHKGKWFAATSHKIINMDYLAMMLLTDSIKEKVRNKEPIIQQKLLFQHRYDFEINVSQFFFLYVKTAFNALAFLKGSDFVQNEIFDDIRESIIQNSNINNFIREDRELLKSIWDFIKKIPTRAHYVIIMTVKNSLIAFVSFYNEKPPAIIQLTERYEGESFMEGLICDWLNRREYKLEELT